MINPTIPALYGQDRPTEGTPKKLVESTNEFEIKTQGKNFVKIKSGKEAVDVPRAKYVKELEDKVERLERDLKSAESDVRRIKHAFDNLAREVTQLRKDVKNKMDKF